MITKTPLSTGGLFIFVDFNIPSFFATLEFPDLTMGPECQQVLLLGIATCFCISVPRVGIIRRRRHGAMGKANVPNVCLTEGHIFL